MKVTVKYVGTKKGGMPVAFPIGEKRVHNVKEVRLANPYLELSQADAEKLLSLNKADHAPSFELVESGPEAVEVEKEEAAFSVPPADEIPVTLVDTQEIELPVTKPGKKKRKK